MKKVSGLHLIPKSKALFIHMPKAAGTSILSSSIFSETRMLSARPLSGHRPLHQIVELLGDDFMKDVKVFTFVRSPLSRFLSAYHYILAGGNHAGDQIIANHIKEHYDDLEDFVDRHHEDPVIAQCPHFQPMWTFLGSTPAEAELAVKRMMFLGRFEKLADDWRRLTELLGDPTAILPRENVTKSSVDLENVNASCIESRQNFVTYYKHDYRLFGYPFPTR